jgi:hypothetical protein
VVICELAVRTKGAGVGVDDLVSRLGDVVARTNPFPRSAPSAATVSDVTSSMAASVEVVCTGVNENVPNSICAALFSEE